MAVPGELALDGAGDAMQGAEALGFVALTHRAELPLAAVTVELAEQHERLVAEVGAEVEARQLLAGPLVVDPDVGVLDVAEALTAALACLPDDDLDADLQDVRRHLGDVDGQLLLLATAPAVVVQEPDGAVGVAAHVGPDEPLLPPLTVGVDRVGGHPVGGVQTDRRDVEVETTTGLPAAGDDDLVEAEARLAGQLRQRDVAALRHVHSHEVFLPSTHPTYTGWPLGIRAGVVC